MTLICPHCGNTDLAKLEYEEVAPVYRRIRELDGAKITIESAYHIYEEDGVRETRILCTECGDDFPVPPEVESLEFNWT